MASLSEGDNNTAVGWRALSEQTTSHGNVAVGSGAGYSTNTAESNVAIGYNSMYYNTTGGNNVCIGHDAGVRMTTGGSNVAVGREAMPTNAVTGSNNTAVGRRALYTATSADSNTAVGRNAGYSISSSAGSTMIGYQAGYSATGNTNTCIGYQAGQDTIPLTSGTGNVVIGTNARTSAGNGEYQIVIGHDYSGNGDNKVNLGSSSGYVWNSFTSNNTWTQVSDRRLKKNIEVDTLGLDFINNLNPVTFNWKPVSEIDPDFIAETANIGNGEKDTETVIHGFIAQDVKEAMDKVGNTTFNGWEESQDGQAVSREMFITPLVKAIQELSATVETLKSEIETLKGE